MAKAGSCLFRFGYFMYTRTRIGYYYHRRDVSKARQKLDGQRHSAVLPKHYNDLQILPIPMMLDNYSYLVTDRQSGASIVIDPGEYEAVQNILQEKNITPAAILVTHKHWDHSGGNADMKNLYPNIPIYGGAIDCVPDATNPVGEGDVLEFGNLKFTVKLTPGHTVGHVVYVLDGAPFNSPNSVFSGDQMFLGGVGRMFEETPATMLHSLESILQLKGDTLMWPGHEYANDNLEFAIHMEPDNECVQKKLEWVREQRKKKLPTCPSTLAEEVTYNPFLRTNKESILRSVGFLTDFKDFEPPTDEVRARALLELRERKDQFKYSL